METIVIIIFLFVGFVGALLGLGIGLFFGAVGTVSKEENAYAFSKLRKTPKTNIEKKKIKTIIKIKIIKWISMMKKKRRT